MSLEIIGLFSSAAKAEAAVLGVRREGFVAADIAVTQTGSETNYVLSIKRGVVWGAILGALMGAALVLYSDSSTFNHWGGILSMPLSGAFGWALYGLILGGSGVLAGNSKVDGILVLSVQLRDPQEFERVASILHDAGVMEVPSSGPVAA